MAIQNKCPPFNMQHEEGLRHTSVGQLCKAEAKE